MASVHQSPFSGSWYPGAVPELQELLDSVLECSRRRTGPFLLPNAVAFVVPHAGLMYSGTVAAAVYRHLGEQKPRRIVLLGFSHRGGPAGVCLPDAAALATPLGTTLVDEETVRRLAPHPPFRVVPEERVCDHSVEIQLPLLQREAPEAPVVPLYVGPLSTGERQAAARLLAELAGDGTVFVASSDLTHFGRAFSYLPFPVDRETAERLHSLDHGVIDDAGSLDASLFLEALESTGSTVCGRAPIALLLETLAAIPREEIFQQTLDYQTSGEITGDFHHSVSYGALGYFPASSFALGPAERSLLLESARATLVRFSETGQRAPVPVAGITPALTRKAGVFVTLHQKGKLRGCVGAPEPRDPLHDAVADLTLAAALDDPRFPPLSARDAAGGCIEIEISVLSPMKRIRGRETFRLHEHGVHLESGWRKSLLLPQVTRERGWTAEKFWEALARKAGLTDAVYDDPETRLHVFRAQILHD